MLENGPFCRVDAGARLFLDEKVAVWHPRARLGASTAITKKEVVSVRVVREEGAQSAVGICDFPSGGRQRRFHQALEERFWVRANRGALADPPSSRTQHFFYLFTKKNQHNTGLLCPLSESPHCLLLLLLLLLLRATPLQGRFGWHSCDLARTLAVTLSQTHRLCLSPFSFSFSSASCEP